MARFTKTLVSQVSRLFGRGAGVYMVSILEIRLDLPIRENFKKRTTPNIGQ